MALLSKVLGRKLNIHSYLGINIPLISVGKEFDKEWHISPLVESITDVDAMPDKIIIDSDKVGSFGEKLQILYDKGHIYHAIPLSDSFIRISSFILS